MRALTSRPAALRAARATVVAGVASTALSGCFYLSDPTTDMQYVPSDGNIATVGPLQVSNVLVVTSAKGAKGDLQGLVTNTSESAQELTVTPQGGAAVKVQVPALQSVRLDGKTNGNDKATISPVSFQATSAAPGEQLQVAFSAKDGEGKQVAVPVVLDQYPYGSASPSHPDSRADESGSKAAH
ncbi:hypothetical protein IEE94_00305 [Yimella sp. cx-573]|nr:hypothetical protein [Yimella sp. cx-573]